MVTTAEPSRERDEVLRHELAHWVDDFFLLRQPRWLNEGLVQLYGTSWLMVDSLANERGAQFNDFQRRLARAEDPQTAFWKSFPDLSDDLFTEEIGKFIKAAR